MDSGKPEIAATHSQVAQGHSAHADEATTEANKIEAAKTPGVGSPKGDGAAKPELAAKPEQSAKPELIAKKP